MEVWLVGLVRAAWIAATLPILIALIPSSSLKKVHEALMGIAKRGKTMHPSSNVSGSLCSINYGNFSEISYYALAPLSLCCTLAPEVFKFAAEQMAAFEFEWWEFVNPLVKLGWLQWIGAAIFLWGWIHQHHCHVILVSLREHPKQINEYVIPFGDWFELVSSPHYLAEIVIYAGLLVASGGADLTIWLLFGFVVANLAFAAADTHRWYLQKFDNYPSNRRAIVPFVY
ncbi:hypothetical protein ACOSQ4_005792 [Xanthoceras sorbifolium]